jgi:nucleotide-binding universal stress UspA family protein
VDEYTVSVSRNFALLRPRLTTPPDIQIEALTLSGNPAAELLRLAGETKADLIAAGSHGYGFITRLVVGSVTSKLLRGAACAVLVVPPDAAPHTLGFELRKRDDASVGWPAYA